ncbi:MAG: flavodoxin family protein [Clostridia bacterium]
MAKILGICGSPRKETTEYVLNAALAAARETAGIETEIMTLRGKKIAPCNACNYCREHQSMCIIKDDMQELFEQFVKADAYIIASPVYVHTITPQLMAFFSRMRPIHHVFPGSVRNKLGAAIAVGGTRNGGEEFAVNTIIHLMMTRGLNIVSNEIGGYIGGKVWSQDKKNFTAEDDVLGMKTVTDLARKLAETAVIYEAGKKALGK